MAQRAHQLCSFQMNGTVHIQYNDERQSTLSKTTTHKNSKSQFVESNYIQADSQFIWKLQQKLATYCPTLVCLNCPTLGNQQEAHYESSSMHDPVH